MTLLALLACGAPPPPPAPAPSPYPSTAREVTWRALQDDLDAPRSPGDGGGRVTLVDGGPVVAGTLGRWRLVYEAGPHGIDAGGRLIFQAPPFWGWSTPHTEAPDTPGFTEVATDAEGVRLEAVGVGQGMLTVEVRGRALAPGARITLVYHGVADRFAEHDTPLWVAVDADGDGVRALVADPPTVDVLPRPPVRLIATLPSVAHPGETVMLRIAGVDEVGNAGYPEPLSLALSSTVAVPDTVTAVDGVVAVPITPEGEGVVVVRVASGDLVGVSNPMVVRAGAQRILWADLQIHSGLSDGTGTPEEVYRYARDVAGLDVAAVTDHDHWGMRFLDQDPDTWDRVVRAAEDAYQPGRFVSVVAYEWTSWLYGHRHVLYFDGSRDLFSSMDPATDTPTELWAALRGKDAVTIAHHSAGGPVAVDWSIPPDPALEPVTEIVSVHGQSESPDVPGVIYDAVPGNFVVDQLARGFALGFVGSTDGHDGHPGLSHLSAPSGGLAALVAEEATREGVLAALRSRRTYATNGPRILLRVEVGGQPMGGVVSPGGEVPVEVRVVGTAPVLRLELVRKQGVVGTARPDTPVAHHRWTLSDLVPGDFVYVRVYQADGGMAWSSPVFVAGP